MNSQSVGISGFAAYLPPYRVDLQSWCAWTGEVWDKIRSVIGSGFRVPGPQEDVYTMAATAVLRLIDQNGIDPRRIGYLALGTESSMDNAAGAVIVRGLVDRALAARGQPRLARDCEVPEIKQACLAGLYGIKGALRYLAMDGIDREAIVVASDIAEYARGSSGEPTQGAGAVAMWLTHDPKMLTLDLRSAGSASSFRALDFRKPFARFAGQPVPANGRLRDFPVFNGKYSTACYVDETLAAVDVLLAKRGGNHAAYFRDLEAVFMHRPYHRMPANAWSLAYLFALATDEAGREELAGYCASAGIEPAKLLAEMARLPQRAFEADFNEKLAEPYPLCAAAAKAFRSSPQWRVVIDDKMSLGSAAMMEAGNLYSGALPAWLAAGFEEAALSGRELADKDLLLVGYGSGDAADAIPARAVPGWQTAANKIRLASAFASAIDLDREQYQALHEGAPLPSPETSNASMSAESNSFSIARVGDRLDGPVQDFGLAYYRLPDGSTA